MRVGYGDTPDPLSCNKVTLSPGMKGGPPTDQLYIPEGAGRCQAANVPVFVAFPGRVWARREEDRGPGGAPGWPNDLEAGPAPGARWIRPGTVMGYVGGAAPYAGRVLGRLAAAFIPSGAWGGFACGQRDQSDRAAARRWRGPVKPAITRCLRPGLLTPPSASIRASQPGGDGCMQLPASARSGGPLLHRIRALPATFDQRKRCS